MGRVRRYLVYADSGLQESARPARLGERWGWRARARPATKLLNSVRTGKRLSRPTRSRTLLPETSHEGIGVRYYATTVAPVAQLDRAAVS